MNFKLSEEGFKQILEQVTDKIKKTTTVVVRHSIICILILQINFKFV